MDLLPNRISEDDLLIAKALQAYAAAAREASSKADRAVAVFGGRLAEKYGCQVGDSIEDDGTITRRGGALNLPVENKTKIGIGE